MEKKKIAFVTDDGTTISSHFGRALYYEIITLDGAAITERERVPKQGHHTFGPQEQHGEHHSEHKHGAMVAPIHDCAVLVARGMGQGAHMHMQTAGIETILTDEHLIDAALQQFITGALANNPKRLHDHGPGHAH